MSKNGAFTPKPGFLNFQFYKKNCVLHTNLLILKDGQTILRASEVDGYKHIYKLGFDGKATQITKGSWDVIDFLGIDESSTTIYYSSAEVSSIQKSIYSIMLK